MTGEWCGPTGQLSMTKLASLVERTRRCTERQKKPTDGLSDPWFEDSQPVRQPPEVLEIVEPKPGERERKERTGIPKVVVATYPIAPESLTTKAVRVALGVGVVSAVAAIALLPLW